MTIEYRTNAPLAIDQFIELLNNSTLGQRRPVDDPECMQGMLDNSNLVISAWQGNALVGVARSVTDFHYACYLSDLAIALNQQKSGIGKKLIELTQAELKASCKLILVAAPKANTYYEHIGFTHNPRCWIKEQY